MYTGGGKTHLWVGSIYLSGYTGKKVMRRIIHLDQSVPEVYKVQPNIYAKINLRQICTISA